MLGGIPGFFEPNPLAFLGAHVPLGADSAGFYSTGAAREDAARARRLLAHQHAARPRLDRRRRARAHQPDALLRQPRDARSRRSHIMASGALPPAFPGRAHRRRALLGRRHPLQYADRGDLRRQSAPQLADLRRAHVESGRARSRRRSGRCCTARRTSSIRAASPATSRGSGRCTSCAMSSRSLRSSFPASDRNSAAVAKLTGRYGCLTRMHVVRLLAPRLDNENHTKDIDFSPSGIR